ncbi:MAG: glycosyltransferase family 4 protein [Chloroflexota bacterium]
MAVVPPPPVSLGELPPGRHFVFIYPQIKKLTGAQRLILALAGAVTTLPSNPPNRVTLLTHRFAPQCRPALPSTVQLIESGLNLNLTGNHYFDSLLEYGAVPTLLKWLPSDSQAICFFGPPSLPGLWWAKQIHHLKKPLLYFCYEPPRAAYTDRAEVSRRMGWAGMLARPLFRAYRPLDRYLTRQADLILVNGQYGQSLIRETYNLPSTIITHGVELIKLPDLEVRVAQLRTRYQLQGKKVILTVNHLHPRKRIDLLLEALALIAKSQPEVVALVVGTGPEEERLRILTASLGLEKRVIFAGFVPEEELVACYAVADLYLHTGRAESFGLAVLEASAAGLPVVAVDEGGPREIILSGETGLLVSSTPKALSEKIEWLFSHPEEAQAMGQRGALRIAQYYTWQRGAEAFVRFNNF